MAVYPKGKKFMASVGAGASRVRRSFNTESEALVWEKEQEDAREAAKALPAPPAPLAVGPPVWNLQKAFDETARHVWRSTPGAPKALINARAALAFFGPDTPCSAIDANWIIEWMDDCEIEHENSGSTCNRKMSALRVMLTRAVEYGNLPALPRMKRRKESQHRIRWFTDAEESVMLKMALHIGYPELHDFIVIGIDTGFRRSESLRLTLGDYSNGLLVAHAGETKNGNARAIPATTRVKAILNSRIRDGQARVFPTLTFVTLRRQWADLRSIMEKDEDKGFIPHVLRHTCATRLVAAQVPLNEVQAWMGHKVIQTTMRYAHLMPGALVGAMARLEERNEAAEVV